MGYGEAHLDQGSHAFPGALGAQTFLEGNRRRVSHFLDKVHDAVQYLVTWGLEHRVLGAIRAIGVDEIQRGKGHKYLTLVYQIDLGCTRLLWIARSGP